MAPWCVSSLLGWVSSLVSVAWIWFLVLVNISGCLDSVRGSLVLAPWLPDSSPLAAWIRFLVIWTWLHGWLVKLFLGSLDSIPGSRNLVPWLPGECSSGCLYLVPGFLDLVPWLPGEGSWLLGFGSWHARLGSMVAWRRLRLPESTSWLLGLASNGWLVKAPGSLDWLRGSLYLLPW